MMKNRMHSLPGKDDITRIELANGMTILARPNFNSPSVVLSGYLMVGGLSDPDEKLGLADFTASALLRGTERRSFQEIYEALESAGASLGFDGAPTPLVLGAKPWLKTWTYCSSCWLILCANHPFQVIRSTGCAPACSPAWRSVPRIPARWLH